MRTRRRGVFECDIVMVMVAVVDRDRAFADIVVVMRDVFVDMRCLRTVRRGLREMKMCRSAQWPGGGHQALYRQHHQYEPCGDTPGDGRNGWH